MTGAWVFVCGPSGAGKDSVLAWAREALAGRSDIVFARRLITRPAQSGSQAIAPGPTLRRVLVTAPQEQLAGRLRRRGRDEAAAIAARLARNVGAAPDADLVIHNDAAIAAAGARPRRFLEALVSGTHHAHATTA